MKTGINAVTVAGNVTRDLDVRFGQSGTAVCKMTIAAGYRRKQGDGWVDDVEFIRCAVFGRQAENCAQYLSKGSEVIVQGRLQTSTYEKNGETRYSTEVVADRVTFVGGKRGGGESTQPKPSAKPSAMAGAGRYDDDDLPF